MAGEIKQITLDKAVRQIHRTCQLHPHPDPQPFFFVVGAGISYPPAKLVLGCKSSRYLKSPFPKDHTIVRLARKWFVRRVFRTATVRERSRDCPPITYPEFMQPSTSFPNRRRLQTSARGL